MFSQKYADFTYHKNCRLHFLIYSQRNLIHSTENNVTHRKSLVCSLMPPFETKRHRNITSAPTVPSGCATLPRFWGRVELKSLFHYLLNDSENHSDYCNYNCYESCTFGNLDILESAVFRFRFWLCHIELSVTVFSAGDSY